MLRSRMNRWAVFATFATALPLSLTAQSVQQTDVPVIEPTFTRIFGSDTVDIYAAGMSPDGRWLVFPVYKGETPSLWLVAAGGGEPIQLVDGDYAPDGAQWFPTSDRIAFRSNRPGHWAIMTLPIDHETGRPSGPPRPVTLEGSSAYFGVSPDGKWIAYTPHENGERVIRIVPSTGGTGRTLIAADTPAPLWSPDGRHIYYHVVAGSQMGLVRISVDGGVPDTVVTGGWVRLGHASLLLSDAGDSKSFTVATMIGEPRARFRLPEEMRIPGLTGPDSNNRFLASMSGYGASLQILPVGGGPARRLTEGREPDAPLGWTNDNRVLFSTKLNGKEVLLLAPVDGGPMRQVSLPDERHKLRNGRVPPPLLSSDGSRLFYQAKGDHPDSSVLKVLSLESGTTREISPDYRADGPGVTGPGGIPHFSEDEFLYLAPRSGRNELRAWTPERGSRVLHTFGDQQSGSVGVHGNRIVFAEYSGDRAHLRTATLGDAESRELTSVIGWLQMGGWSPDGRYVAMVHVDTSGAWESARVAFLRVSESGEAVGDLRYVSESSLSWWNLQWLPDSRGVVAVGWDDHNVWLFPVDPAERPVCLTQDNQKDVYEFVLSPDGQHIVYPSPQPRGSSIWLVDLGDIPEVSR